MTSIWGGEGVPKVTPKPFPNITTNLSDGIPVAAHKYVQAAKSHKLCDEWLRTPLGNRNVPTRFDGWEESLRITLGFLVPYSQDKLACTFEDCDFLSYDLQNYSVRFGVCQAEFYRRLDGYVDQALNLLKCQKEAIRGLMGTIAEEKFDLSKVNDEVLDNFFATASDVFLATNEKNFAVDKNVFPELMVVRPVHPRFASVDPMEPLPWNTRDPEKYRERMKRLGYTI